ncbi:MAG TPA: GNAT family N-acetyltransferase [Tepidisphaeraceae bacterium]
MSCRWVGEDEMDRVAETRCYCYAPASKELEYFKDRIRADERGKPGDWMLAERNGVAVGTITSLSFNMWVRGAKVPCQGIAYVGTIKTHRRVGKGTEKGIASQLMCEALNKARERKEVVTALMPFRASYYEHFGYGMIERRNDWTIPISVLPSGDFDGMRFMTSADLPLIQACHQRAVQAGQCDLERSAGGWSFFGAQWSNGYVVVDQPRAGAVLQSWMYFVETKENGKTTLRVDDAAWDSQAALLRQLYFLGSLKDQYTTVQLSLPIDLPVNWLLKESQIPHRPIEHAAARVSQVNRLQVRILDHVRLLAAMKLPEDVSGRTTVAVKECEGNVSTFSVEIESGRISAKPARGNAEVEFVDKVWAALVCGDVSATTLARMGLIRASDQKAIRLLDAFSVGPAPFCNERF